MSQPGLQRSSSRSKRSTTNLANLRLAPLSAKYTEQSIDRTGPKTPYDEAAEATLAKYVYRQGRSLPSTPGHHSPNASRRHGGGLSRRESMLDDEELPEIFHQYARSKSGRSDDAEFEHITKSVSEAGLSAQLPHAGQAVSGKRKSGHKRSKTAGNNTPRSKSRNRIKDDDWLSHTGATANALLLESKGATWLQSRPSSTNLVIADDDDDEGYEEMAALSASTTRVTDPFEEGQKTPKQERWGSRFGSRPASRHASRRGSVAAGARTPTSNRDQLADYFERASLQQQGQVIVDDSEDETEDDNDEHLTALTKDRSFGLGPYVDKLMFSVFNLPEEESGADTGNEEAETAAEAKARRLREAKRRQQEKDRLIALPSPENGTDGEKVGVWQDVSWLVNVAQRTFS